MNQPVPPRDIVKSIERGFAVLAAFDRQHGSMTLDEASTRSGISRSATRRLLMTLCDCGLVDVDGYRFTLTSKMLDLGYAQQSRKSLVEVVAPHASTLGETTGCSVGIAVLDGPEVVYLARFNAPRLIEISLRVGSRLPAHLLAIGRAQLAWRTPTEIASFMQSPAYQEHIIEGPEGAENLVRELARIRHDGWSYANGVVEDGLSAIAAPIRDQSGKVVAGINVAGHAALTSLEKFVPDLLRASAEISKDLHSRHLS